MGRKGHWRLPRKYSYTLADIGALVGLRPSAMRFAVKGRTYKKKGKDGVVALKTIAPLVDPTSLLSVIVFVLERSSEEQAKIARLLFAAGCDPTKAAAALGISRSALYRRAKKVTTA